MSNQRISDLLKEFEEVLMDMRVKHTRVTYFEKLNYIQKLDIIRHKILVANMESPNVN